ncbi:macoilin-like [Tigriopus californicus]|uniref:macoilin-like n=1 Tax=Tigriopus californicus TaxID=6832 RepID=UPI0027DA4383|nr:macoilin-like [Tigriopus californicus]
MKRRSGGVAGPLEAGRLRRPVKRSPKMAESFFGSSLIYVKLLFLWMLVLLADYFLEFRFEYLWPFWLFMRSVYDSFKYQGLAFSVFFICIAVTSDLICFLFIPFHWLFFAASTYVWVQYVWHTEKGVCLPTIVLWILFVYVEASIRLKEFRAHVDLKHLPLHLDLCRPFAAHCIGYPVVTLGFGFKSSMGYRMRVIRQREVQRENECFFQVLREALPPGPVRDEAFYAIPPQKVPCGDECPDGAVTLGTPVSGTSVTSAQGLLGYTNHDKKVNGHPICNGADASSSSSTSSSSSNRISGKWPNGTPVPEHELHQDKSPGDDDHRKSNNSKSSTSNSSSAKEGLKKGKENKPAPTKEEIMAKMEQDLKRVKIELQLSRNKENDLRDQIISYMSSERHLKSEISNLQVEKSVLESRIASLVSTRASEKAALSSLEKKLADERKQKTDFQIKLETERKTKKEAANAERTAHQHQTRSEVAKLESEIATLRNELQAARERCHGAEQDLYVLRKFKETHGEPEVLVNTVKTLAEKNKQTQKNLSAETKMKMDLLSAFGEAKREISIKHNLLLQREKEISDLKSRVAEFYAVMPSSTGYGVSSAGLNTFSAPTTLSLDLPASTDLSYPTSNKMSSLGLADLKDKLTGSSSNGIYGSRGNPGGYSSNTNGSNSSDL